MDEGVDTGHLQRILESYWNDRTVFSDEKKRDRNETAWDLLTTALPNRPPTPDTDMAERQEIISQNLQEALGRIRVDNMDEVKQLFAMARRSGKHRDYGNRKDDLSPGEQEIYDYIKRDGIALATRALRARLAIQAAKGGRRRVPAATGD